MKIHQIQLIYSDFFTSSVDFSLTMALRDTCPKMKEVVLKNAKKPKVWKIFKKTQDEIIKRKRQNNDPMKKGNARDLELLKRKFGMEKSEPEAFH